MFQLLEQINERPKPFEFYTAAELWTNDYTSKQMLNYHLNGDIDVSSRNFKFIDKSTKWIAEYFNLGEDKSVADFGCGPGLYAGRLAATGAKVTAIDFSKTSVEYAKGEAEKNNLHINYVNENYLEFNTEEKFDVVIMIMCDYCALSDEQRKGILAKFRNMLKPGGKVLLDVYTTHSYNKKNEAATYELNQLFGFWSPEKYYGFVNTFKYDDVKVVLDKYTIVTDKNVKTVYNWLKHFTVDDLRNEFINAGFTVEGMFSDVAGTPFENDNDEMAIVAIK